jgi:prepilin-type N-terminal cleavage/methylation domain-containing protein
MKRSSSFAPKAFTLIEVVASLLLVGTLLVVVMAGHRRLVHQARLAQERIAAVEALDDLLAHADDSDVNPLVELEGKVPGNNLYVWRTTLRDDTAAAQFGGVIVRIELFDQSKDAAMALAAVELLQPGGESRQGWPSGL